MYPITFFPPDPQEKENTTGPTVGRDIPVSSYNQGFGNTAQERMSGADTEGGRSTGHRGRKCM